MSATNRGTKRSALDGYYTPPPLANAIVNELALDGYLARGDNILEPSVGKGAFVEAISERMGGSVVVDGCDLAMRKGIKELWGRCDCAEHLIHSKFEKLPPDRKYDLICGNPPFDLAEEHVRHAMKLLNPRGCLAFLLRLNFLAGRDRAIKLYEDFPLDTVFVLDKRPSFGKVVHCAGDAHGLLSCGWQISIGPLDEKPAVCPSCGSKTKANTSDATEYCVMLWRKTPLAGFPALRHLLWGYEYDVWAKAERAKRKAA